jgi:tetratricopeptide (TPR) repeat protein
VRSHKDKGVGSGSAITGFAPDKSGSSDEEIVMQGMHINMLRSLTIRIYIGIVVPAMICSLIAGCATKGKVKPAKIAQGPSVARLGQGREGFVITEVPHVDESTHRSFDRAVAMLKQQDYDKAISLFEKVIKQSPGVTAPYIDIAMAYERINKPKQAETYLKTALKLFPDHPVACNEYGLLYRKTGRFAEARAIYEKALARFPDYYPLHRNLGILCDLYLNDPACALKQYEICSKARPDDKQVKSWIADLRVRLGHK